MCESCQSQKKDNKKEILVRLLISTTLLIIGFISQNKILYIISYLIAGYDIILTAIKNITKKNFFDENFLMSMATIGAIYIGEYPEAVCVMVLYQIGEFLQDKAVEKSKKSIQDLIKIIPEYINVEENGQIIKKQPEEAKINDIIVINSGERVSIDGEIIFGSANIDSSAITGESRLELKKIGDKIISGCINTDGMIKIKAEKTYKDSTISKIMELVEHAGHKKSKTEKFITKFAKIYTPIVVVLAILIGSISTIFFGLTISDAIHRALTFLVISCPCAFVISVPLTFFSGIGRASKSGILIKGSNYIELLAKTSTAVFDKTGTLTKGIFKVTKIKPEEGYTKEEILNWAALAEYHSNHPIAKAIKEAATEIIEYEKISKFTEIAGVGVNAIIDGHEITLDNKQLLTDKQSNDNGTKIYITKDKKEIGHIIISDEIKENSKKAIEETKKLNIKTAMLSGDKKEIVQNIAEELHIDKYYAQLLPKNKVEKLEEIMNREKGSTIYTGDGINDAPVLMRSDVGIAMGAMGSDAAIDSADIIITDDNIMKIPMAIKIAKRTILIAKENIFFALFIKILFLLLGAMGLITMWGAVFADVGVCLLAVLNSLRTLKMKNLYYN